MKRWVGLGLIVAVGGCSCGSEKAGTPSARPAPGRFIATPGQLSPTTPPPAKAKLVLDGTVVPVTVRASQKEDIYELDLVTGGEVFDIEKYATSPTSFAVTSAAGEEYLPPLPILEFPFHVGDERHWKGTLSSERNPLPASAKITTADDKVYLGTVPLNAVRADVVIWIERAKGESPSERKLSFWFAVDRGLVKRVFGESSVREPGGI